MSTAEKNAVAKAAETAMHASKKEHEELRCRYQDLECRTNAIETRVNELEQLVGPIVGNPIGDRIDPALSLRNRASADSGGVHS